MINDTILLSEAAKLRASLAHLEKIELAKKLDLLEQAIFQFSTLK